jgi:UDP-N-acetylmuramoylalanine--D-glutamate ligase
MRLETLKKHNILILGLGREGESTLKFLDKYFPKKFVGLADELEFEFLASSLKKLIKKRKGDKLFLGKDYLKAIPKYKIIIKTPGIPFLKIKSYLKKGQIVTSQTDIFLEKFRDKTIGITGTKGKSTTTSLIYHILKKAKKDVLLVGNIGNPCLDYFNKAKKKTIFVFEMSSHQLSGLKVSPKIAVFLNIYKEHLDYYRNFQEYFSAKKNITRWQKEEDYFVFNNEIKALKELSLKTKAETIPFGIKNKKGCYLKDNWIYFERKKIIPIKEIPLKGRHNLFNTMAAVAVGMILEIEPKIIKKAIKEFRPLAHRLELVGKFKGALYYNDSLATIPEATIEAINSISETETLILGGYERGQDFRNLIKVILKKKIKNLILLPETGKRIYQEIKKEKGRHPNCFFANNMKKAVEIALNVTKKGACLMSPASASFGLFRDYKDRGEQFKRYLKILTKNEKNNKKK